MSTLTMSFLAWLEKNNPMQLEMWKEEWGKRTPMIFAVLQTAKDEWHAGGLNIAFDAQKEAYTYVADAMLGAFDAFPIEMRAAWRVAWEEYNATENQPNEPSAQAPETPAPDPSPDTGKAGEGSQNATR